LIQLDWHVKGFKQDSFHYEYMTNKQPEKTLHNNPVPQVNIENVWRRKDDVIIDVRSPLEFESGSIPGSINIPLLSDSEREIIGIIYKNKGQESAIEKGYDVLEAKNSNLFNKFKGIPKSKTVSVLCARGGMRSKVVTSLLLELGYGANQIIGGYKRFRNWNLEQLEKIKIPYLVVLHGKTGVGKTKVLNGLENSIDLEKIAEHRGSIFGGIGKKPVFQKNFEANLLLQLEKLDLTRPVYVEGESRKIGKISVPSNLFAQMLSGKNIILTSLLENRVKRIVQEYVLEQPDMLDELRNTIQKLSGHFGKRRTELLLKNFDQADYDTCFCYILEEYYDHKYNHFINQLSYIEKVSTDDLEQAILKIKSLDYKKLCNFNS